MTDRIALDTNVLVYSLDGGAPNKQARAKEILSGRGGAPLIIPAQALAETSRVLLVKRRPPLPPDDVGSFIQSLAAAFAIVPLTHTLVEKAIRGVKEYQLSYFDAQIWAASKQAGAAVLLTEDGQDGQSLEGVRIINPFSDTFDLGKL